jgi:hypothetical protein
MPIIDIEGVGEIDLPDDATPEDINRVVNNVAQARQAVAPKGVEEYIPRQLGLTIRGMTGPVSAGAGVGAALGATLGGVGAAPGAAAGAVAGATLDIVPRIYNTIAEMAGSERRLPPLGDVLERIKTDVGLPEPITTTEKVAQGAMEATTSLAAPLGAGRFLTQAASPSLRAAGTILSEQPYMQAIQAPLAGGASRLAEEKGAGTAGQVAAGVGAAAVPTLANITSQAIKTGLRGGLRAGAGGTEAASPQEIARNIETFRAAGTTPTAGQATQRIPVMLAESGMSRIPGSAGVVREFAGRQQKQISEKLAQIREELSPVSEPSVAGTAIREGVPETFAAKRGVERRLYSDIENYIQPNMLVQPSNFKGTLDQISGGIKGAPALSEVMSNPKLASIRTAFDADLDKKTGTLPYEAIKSLRSRIGENLAGISILNDVPRAEFKRLYAALSEDMRQAAAKAGPGAVKALNRANKYSEAMHARADKLQSFINRQEPEAIFQAALQGSKIGGTRLAALMKSLPKEDQKAVTSAFVARMGMAPSGLQNEAGEIFSTNTFLTNWNNLSKPARQQLFGRYGSEFSSNMDKIARTAALIRRGGNIQANPSGTAGALMQVATITSLAGSFGAGKFGFAKGILGVLGTSYLGSKLFTSPRYVEWLAKNIDVSPNAIPTAVASLQEIARDEDNPELDAFAEMVRRAELERSLNK